jgi:hypothetical protein
MCTAFGTCYTFKLTGCWPGQNGTSFSEYLLMMGNKHSLNMYRLIDGINVG